MKHELYKTKEEIKTWLNQYEIKNYELIDNKEYGFLVNVYDNVDLNFKNITEIKVKFNIISGYFDISRNKLISLYGCPNIINTDFYCDNNQLETLEGCPQEIKEDFHSYNNKLNTLSYFPEKVTGKCYINNNPELKELEDISDFEELKKMNDAILLNKKLEKDINIDNRIKNDKIKL